MRHKQKREYIRYLEEEADYLENYDPQRYQDMIEKRRAEAQRVRKQLREG